MFFEKLKVYEEKIAGKTRKNRVFLIKPHAYVANGVSEFFGVRKKWRQCSTLVRAS